MWKIITPNTLELGIWNLKKMFITPCMSHYLCHISCVTCHISYMSDHPTVITRILQFWDSVHNPLCVTSHSWCRQVFWALQCKAVSSRVFSVQWSVVTERGIGKSRAQTPLHTDIQTNKQHRLHYTQIYKQTNNIDSTTHTYTNKQTTQTPLHTDIQTNKQHIG